MRGLQLILLIASVVIFTSCNNQQQNDSSHYPEPRPDSVALDFMPGVVTTDSLDFNSCFSPDGKTFYYCRGNKGQWDIYMIQHDGKQWGPEQVAPFSDPLYSEADPAFAPDGSLYFISNRPNTANDSTKDFDIWFTFIGKDRQWVPVRNAGIVNSDTTEYYVSFADNGDMYFASNRAGGLGEEDIYISRFVNDKYTTPQNLGTAINSKGSDHDPCVARDGSYLIFTSAGRPDSVGEADLYCSTIDANKQWTPARHLSKRFNTPTYEYCPMFSPDGKYFFFSSELDIKWIDAKYLLNEIQSQ
jgi:Tol biopolymer transport system component